MARIAGNGRRPSTVKSDVLVGASKAISVMRQTKANRLVSLEGYSRFSKRSPSNTAKAINNSWILQTFWTLFRELFRLRRSKASHRIQSALEVGRLEVSELELASGLFGRQFRDERAGAAGVNPSSSRCKLSAQALPGRFRRRS